MACSSAGQEFGRHQHKRHHRTQALLVVVPLEVVAGPAVGVGDDVAGGAVLAHEVDQHAAPRGQVAEQARSEEHTSELQSLMRISYAVFCLKKKTNTDSATVCETIC